MGVDRVDDRGSVMLQMKLEFLVYWFSVKWKKWVSELLNFGAGFGLSAVPAQADV